MTSSRAALEVRDGAAIRAFAAAPQRWNRPTRTRDGWLATVHQVVGDGLFPGDLHRTRISIRGESKAIVRGITATALRSGTPPKAGGAIMTRIAVSPGATLLYLPGPLLPHASSATTHGLRLDVEEGGSALVVSMVLAGRRGHGESGAFTSLRLRTTARIDGQLAFADDTTILPGDFSLDGPAGFAGGEAAISVLALGAFPPAQAAWWDALPTTPNTVTGASQLPRGGTAIRAIAATLGAAQSWLETVETAVR